MLLSQVQQYGNLELLARQVVEGFITGLHNSPNHGFSVEFAEHKPYNRGMNIRNIDWKLFARSNKLFVKQFEEETNLRCRILLDVSGSMQYPQETQGKLKFATLASAAICNMLKKQRDAYGLTTFNNGLLEHSQLKSNDRHYVNILGQLDKYWTGSFKNEIPNETKDLASMLNYIASTSPKRSLIIILSDMLDENAQDPELWQALQHLKHGKNELILFHLQDTSTEINLNFDSREYRFEHLETGEKLVLNPSEIKQAYSKEASAFYKAIQEKCLSYNIDHYPINIAEDFNQLLLTFYQKRRRMQR